MSTHPNRSPLYTYRSYDQHADTAGGYLVIVRADGTLRIELESRWQGTMTGTTWIAKATEAMMRLARGEEQDDEEEPELDVLLADFLSGNWQSSAKRIRLGERVR